ncbi:MAG: hypothetical protein IPI35_14775 [Deltaproteobacteria bacterium]|nr:hypothetical protein [Deltaproteobacteria bacterium]
MTGVPRTAELRGALREALETQGQTPSTSADLAADMLQVALRGLGRAVVLESPQLAEQLTRASGLSDAPLQTLLELARSPRFGQSLSKEELRVFGERFGELALSSSPSFRPSSSTPRASRSCGAPRRRSPCSTCSSPWRRRRGAFVRPRQGPWMSWPRRSTSTAWWGPRCSPFTTPATPPGRSLGA